MHTSLTDAPASTTTAPPRARWRVVDIVTASVLGVVAGVVFWAWGAATSPLSASLEALLPGIQGLINGPWLFAGVLGALVVRKPGAALYTELLAAVASALIGTQWGPLVLLSGLVQGLGVEIVLAVLLYRYWSLPVALLAGAGAGIGESILDLLVWYPGSRPSFAVTYALSTTVSGIVVAGLGSYLLMRGLAASGALDRFAAGRARARRV